MLRKILKKKNKTTKKNKTKKPHKVVTAKKGLSNEVYDRAWETDVYTGFFQIQEESLSF